MSQVWLIGAGSMARSYVKVLQGLEIDFGVVGRGEESARKCEEATGCVVSRGGLDAFLSSAKRLPDYAIVAVGAEVLYETTKKILSTGIKNILVEKPGALSKAEFAELLMMANEKKSNLLIAYNRRFYAATQEAQRIIEQDGGVLSFHFEFTEWAHVIKDAKRTSEVKERWFLANSTHVVDLAFFLGGKPKEMCSFVASSLDWHPSASIFSGAGTSESGALFSYQANWESAGRWSVEVLTREHRLVFCPMEKLQVQKRGSIQLEPAEIDYGIDETYKPGLFHQTQQFLAGRFERFCSMEEQYGKMDLYNKIANYKEV